MAGVPANAPRLAPLRTDRLSFRARHCLIFLSLPNPSLPPPNTVEGLSRSVYRSHEVAALIEQLRGRRSAPANSAPLAFMNELGARARPISKHSNPQG